MERTAVIVVVFSRELQYFLNYLGREPTYDYCKEFVEGAVFSVCFKL